MLGARSGTFGNFTAKNLSEILKFFESCSVARPGYMTNKYIYIHIYIYIYIYIIIIWPSLATSPNRSSPLAGLQGYILYPHRATVCMFELAVLLLLSHMWGSIGVHRLWACPCFSSSVLDVWFIELSCSWWEVGGRIVGALWGVASRTCSILLAAFLCNWHLAFSPAVLLASK